MKPTQEQVIAWAWKAADGIMSFDAYGTEILSKHEFIELANLAYEAGRKDENAAFEKELSKEDPEWLDDEAFLIVTGLLEWTRARREQ